VRAEAGAVVGRAGLVRAEPESEPGARAEAVRAEAAGHHVPGRKVMEQFPCAADGLVKSRLEVFRAPV
jgi:hypothetical protein